MPAIQTPPRLVEPWGRGRGRDISREVGDLGEERGVRGISGREGGEFGEERGRGIAGREGRGECGVRTWVREGIW